MEFEIVVKLRVQPIDKDLVTDGIVTAAIKDRFRDSAVEIVEVTVK